MVEDKVAGSEQQFENKSDKFLQIKKVIGSYTKSLGLNAGDIIIGLDGDLFVGDSEQLKDYFEIDEVEDDDHVANEMVPILTIKREEVIFNVFCYKRIICKFDQIENPFPQPNEKLQKVLENAKSSELSEYLIYYDNKKNAHLLLRSKSLLAMVAPPFWFLNQRMPEAMLASILGGLATISVHWILGALYYAILCLYVGREQLNLAINFMSYKRLLYLQPIACSNEFEAQSTALAIDSELYFQRPVEGLVQNKKRRKKKKTPVDTGAIVS